jgi:phosphoglycolate phosphatase
MRAVVFDLDGTLADTVDDIHAAMNAALAALAMAPVSRQKIIESVGGGVARLMEQVVTDAAMREAALIQFTTIYDGHLLDRTVLYPGAREAIEAMSGLQLAVLSNKPSAMTKRIVEGLGLAPFFRIVYGGDSMPVKKPDPATLRRVCQELGVEPRETVLVGDSKYDVMTAKNAGAVACAVSWGYARPGDLDGADYVVDSFAAVVEVARKTASPIASTPRQSKPESQ